MNEKAISADIANDIGLAQAMARWVHWSSIKMHFLFAAHKKVHLHLNSGVLLRFYCAFRSLIPARLQNLIST